MVCAALAAPGVVRWWAILLPIGCAYVDVVNLRVVRYVLDIDSAFTL